MLEAASIVLSAAAGACAYLFFLNRYLIQIRDARHKSLLIRAGGLLSMGCAGLLGYFAAGTSWMGIPAAIVLIALMGEVRRVLERRYQRGQARVSSENARIRLTQPDTTTALATLTSQITVPGWRGPALRIAHMSDLHVNSHLPLAFFEAAMRRVAAARPDLLLFTGDFITYLEFAGLLPPLLKLARGRLGTFGVLGNHDHWAGAQAVSAILRSAGITLVGNDSQRISLDNGTSVLVAGCELPWSSTPWQPPPVLPGDLALMLTHTADNIYRLSRSGATAVFAGHYHGGQMRLPGLGALVVPSRYGRRFDHGHFVVGQTHLFVTAGIGSADPPLRLWCQPDVLIVDIKPGP